MYFKKIEDLLVEKIEPRIGEKLDPEVFPALAALIKVSFPREDVEDRLQKVASSDLVYLIWSDEKRSRLAALGTREVHTLEFGCRRVRALYFRNSAVDLNFRRRGLHYFLLNLPVSEIKAEEDIKIIGTTTQAPAVYKNMRRVAEGQGFVFWPRLEPLARPPARVLEIGRALIAARGQDSACLDCDCVRRAGWGRAFYDAPPFQGFAPFEQLSLGPTDAVLVMGIAPDLLGVSSDSSRSMSW